MKDPNYVIYGVGTGGGPGGTHIYANLADLLQNDSPQAKQFVALATLGALANYASSIRDEHSAAYKVASEALTIGTRNLAGSFGVPGMG